MFKVVCAIIAGNTLEIYSFVIYSFFAPILAENFFPEENKLVGIASIFGILLFSVLTRPLGAIFFGRMGDNFGRKSALIASIWLMAFSTVALSLLPNYATIGIWAPLLLLVVRLLQGFSYGGELMGSVIFLVEHAPRANKGFYGSFAVVGINAGILLACLVTWLIHQNFSYLAIANWAWRLPFLFSLLGCLVGWLMRRNVSETELFLKTQRIPWNYVTLYHEYTKNISNAIIIIAMMLFATVLAYLLHIFSFIYMNNILHYSLSQALSINILSIILLISLLPSMGKLSDHIGRRPVMALALIGAIIWALPYFLLLQQNIVMALLAQLVMTLFAAAYFAVAVVTIVEIISIHMRFSIVAFNYAVAVSLFGGMTPFIAILLVRTTYSSFSLALYLVVCALISLIAVYKVRETKYSPSTGGKNNDNRAENENIKGKISIVAEQLKQ